MQYLFNQSIKEQTSECKNILMNLLFTQCSNEICGECPLKAVGFFIGIFLKSPETSPTLATSKSRHIIIVINYRWSFKKTHAIFHNSFHFPD
jgi:hypothetical protein